MARNPEDDATLSPRAAAQRPARRLKQELQRVSRRSGIRRKKPLKSGEKGEVGSPGASEEICFLLSRVQMQLDHRVQGRESGMP